MRWEGGQVSSNLLPVHPDICRSQRPSLCRAFPLPLQLLWVKGALRNVGLFSVGHLLFGYLVWCWLLENFIAFKLFCLFLLDQLSGLHCKQPNFGVVNITLCFVTSCPFSTTTALVFPIQKFKTGFLNLPYSLTLPAAAESGQLNEGLVGT